MAKKKAPPPSPEVAGFSGQGDDPPEPCDAADGLTARQAKALEALVQEPTMARAAAVAGVGERSLRRWLTEPKFRTAVYRARREAFGQAIWLTQRYAAVAVATLVKVMQDAAAPPSSKVSAAGLLLKFGREGIELDDLAERVEALERGSSNGSTTSAKKRTDRSDDGQEDSGEDEA
jgi:hypothetical protein